MASKPIFRLFSFFADLPRRFSLLLSPVLSSLLFLFFLFLMASSILFLVLQLVCAFFLSFYVEVFPCFRLFILTEYILSRVFLSRIPFCFPPRGPEGKLRPPFSFFTRLSPLPVPASGTWEINGMFLYDPFSRCRCDDILPPSPYICVFFSTFYSFLRSL